MNEWMDEWMKAGKKEGNKMKIFTNEILKKNKK